MTVSTTIAVRPISGVIGAEIDGVDLRQPLDDAVVGEIRQALLRWKVVFFRDQNIDEEQHVAFGRRFGDVTPGHPLLPPAFPAHPEIFLLDNQAGAGGIRRDGEAHPTEARWHTDVTFVTNPPMGSILRGVVVPAYGGDTQWTNLVAAYEAQSAPLQRLCDELHAVHQNRLHFTRGDVQSEIKARFEAETFRAVHPVVRVHPETGERSLFVHPGSTQYITELSRKEGDHLLALLYEHITSPSFTCRFRWAPNSIAFWDNRVTCHLSPTDVPRSMHRSMQRITLGGDIPVGTDGNRSYALEGSEPEVVEPAADR